MSVYFIYIFVALLSYVTPGPDWLIVSKNTFRSKREGMLSALGVQCGLFFHMILAVIGASAIFLASKNAFYIIQMLGGLYIVWIGFSSLKELHSNRDKNAEEGSPQKVNNGAFLSGLTANILNPKVAIFFISILPQFVSEKGNIISQVITLGIIDILVGVVWWVAFVSLIGKLYKLAKDESIRNRIEFLTGSLLLIIGVIFIIKSMFSMFG
ncbi:LysE family translocator [Erwinia piriflorinigrans]|uniref:Homoserine/homoserine lactone efflux protein n=1 Tax=Erwinia piriflorinigrans CFBP 5888 TaxID=1161919 RepID=V5Z565_9GAMM|nr:LysE family translocator [Erwinia piriflorinigrans]CCG86056.1 Homoserine/homoserine lactone efflux protein [Erwinia piriflorinigrans CFBP 5888]